MASSLLSTLIAPVSSGWVPLCACPCRSCVHRHGTDSASPGVQPAMTAAPLRRSLEQSRADYYNTLFILKAAVTTHRRPHRPRQTNTPHPFLSADGTARPTGLVRLVWLDLVLVLGPCLGWCRLGQATAIQVLCKEQQKAQGRAAAFVHGVAKNSTRGHHEEWYNSQCPDSRRGGGARHTQPRTCHAIERLGDVDVVLGAGQEEWDAVLVRQRLALSLRHLDQEQHTHASRQALGSSTTAQAGAA